MVKVVTIFVIFVSFFATTAYGGGGNNGWTGSPFTGPPPTGMFPMGNKNGQFDRRPTVIPPMARGRPPTGMPARGPPPTGSIMSVGRGIPPSGPPPTGMSPTGVPPSGRPIQAVEGEIRQKRQQNQGSNFGAVPPPLMGDPNNGQFGQGPYNEFNGQQPFNGNQGGFGMPQPQERSLPTQYGQYTKKRSMPTEYGQYRKK